MFWKLLNLSLKFNTKFHFNNPLIINFLTWKNVVFKKRWYKKFLTLSHLTFSSTGWKIFNNNNQNSAFYSNQQSFQAQHFQLKSCIFTSALQCIAYPLLFLSNIVILHQAVIYWSIITKWGNMSSKTQTGNYMAIGDYRVTQTFIYNLLPK